MANEKKIQQICPSCYGLGVVTENHKDTLPPYEETWITKTCPTCLGEKMIDWGQLSQALINQIKSIEDKCDSILAKL